ncbi:MAG: hypothetical protein ACXVX0_15760 [Blastococcus sp.]
MRAHRNSLLALVAGFPAAWLVAGIWSLIVGTSSFGGNPRVTGWKAVLYDLPGYLLMLGAMVASLVWAARALRLRARGAGWGFVASSVGLLLVLLLLGTVVADTTSAPSSASLNWLVRGAMALIAVAAVLGAWRWARRTPGH